MNKFITMMVALIATLFAVNSFAWDPPASPAPASWISDTSGVLSAEAHTRLDAKLKQINQSSANELSALIVPTLDGQSIEDVTNATFKSWGVGKKGLDNGVLVVLAMKEHKSRIETGKGVEGDLPDLKTQDILNNVVRPYMRKGDVEGALGNSFDAISTSIANHKADVAAGRTSSDGSGCTVSSVGLGGGWEIGILMLMIGLLLLVANVLSGRKRRQAKAELQQKTERLRQEEVQRRKASQEARLQRERDAEAVAFAAMVKKAAFAKPAEEPVKKVTHTDPSTVRAVPRPKSRGTVESVAAAAELERERVAQQERNRRAAEEREEESRARRQREEDEEEARRRRRDDDDSSSSSSSSGSGFDWGSGSGGFGGGDSGGGGSSSDW